MSTIFTLAEVALLLNVVDDVVVSTRELPEGTTIDLGEDRGTITLTGLTPRSHKIAIRSLPAGAQVRKYGQIIGLATRDITAGDHVHVHNLGMDSSARNHDVGSARTPLTTPALPMPTFLGYPRSDGRVGTRNYIGIVTSVNCSATAANLIANSFRESDLAEFSNVDGVMALTHQSGCGIISTSEGAQVLVRTLRGYAAHPNFAGILVVGLGCEMVPVDSLVTGKNFPSDTIVSTMNIQDEGGIRATVAEGVARIRAMLPELNERTRIAVPVSELVLGLNCGGSDGYSGITANPALGVASDLLVAYGGTSILAETPEIFGAEHLLTSRAVSPAVAEKLLERIEWWKEYAHRGGGSLDNNPSPGNKAGGLTTILEKSLGAVAKGGQAELSAVYEYAEPVTSRGLVFMDTPGYDPVSVTGIIAGGATVVCFTTGRGSVFGAKPTPSIKLATNTEMYTAMPDDMDLNAGRIIDGTATLAAVGAEIFDLIIRVASGERTVSEELGIGQEEFVPWQFGTVT